MATAKYKKGEWVKIKGGVSTGGYDRGEICRVRDVWPGKHMSSRSPFVYVIEGTDEGITYHLREEDIDRKATPAETRRISNSIYSRNTVVANALAAQNGAVEDKYRVTLDTLTLDGKGKTSKVVTAAKLKQILTFLRQPQTFDTVLAQVAKYGSTDMAAEIPFQLNLVVEKA